MQYQQNPYYYMPYIILHYGNSIMECVEFCPADAPHAQYIDDRIEKRIRAAILEEHELLETLRTGLPRKARGTKK